MTDKRSDTDRVFFKLRRFLANRGYISNFRVVFSNSCVEQYMYYVIMFRLRQWGDSGGDCDITQAQKCWRETVKVHGTILFNPCQIMDVYLWLYVHDIGSGQLCEHQSYPCSRLYDACLLLQWCHPCMRICFMHLVRELSCRCKYCLYI